MSDILLLEPGSYDKRRSLSDMFIEPERARRMSIVDIKKRLREIRDYSLHHQNTLFKKLITVLNACSDKKVSFAEDASHAVERINEINGNKTIAINKSAVITRELLPLLNTYSHKVIDSYFDELKPYDNRFKEYWQLPDISFESTWDSFKKPVDLNLLRKMSIQNNGLKDFTGLIGLNAISASDGAIIMLQHTNNIKTIFEQASKIIFVVGLDKIIRNRDEALFIAKCMAAFGVGALPLNMKGKNQSDPCVKSLSNNPISQEPDNIHIILLDNGRSQIMKSDYKDILTCIGCRACIKSCPASPHFMDGTHLSPRDYIYSFISGQNPSLDRCLQCKSCESNCPLNIDIPGMILNGKRAVSKRRRPFSDQLLSNVDIIEQLASNAPRLVASMSKNRLLRQFTEKLTGISSERKFPNMSKTTFVKQFRSMEERIEASSENAE